MKASEWIKAMIEDKSILTPDEKLIAEGEAAVDRYLVETRNILAERYRRAFERSECSFVDWIEATLEMAATLREAREQFKNDREFSIWLATNDLNMHNHDDRAALINMGRNPDLTRIVLQETQRQSLRLIWRDEIAPRVRSAAKPPAQESSLTETRDSAPPAPAKAEPVSPTSVESKVKLGERHPFIGHRRAEEVAAIYQHTKTRGTIGKLLGKRGGGEVWKMMLELIDAGVLRPTNFATDMPSIRLLFPEAPLEFTRRLSLAEEHDRKKIRNEIMPVVLRCRDEIIAAPIQIVEILQREAAANRERIDAELRTQKLQIARQSLPASEPEVVLYGKHYWPIIDISDPDQRYDYGQLVAAAWFFDDARRLARAGADNSPKSCGMKIRFLVKRLSEFNETIPVVERPRWRQVFALIVDMTRMMEKSPELEVGNRQPLLPLDKAHSE
jgi:hypothetical protein